jgi:hypothetical protein
LRLSEKQLLALKPGAEVSLADGTCSMCKYDWIRSAGEFDFDAAGVSHYHATAFALSKLGIELTLELVEVISA